VVVEININLVAYYGKYGLSSSSMIWRRYGAALLQNLKLLKTTIMKNRYLLSFSLIALAAMPAGAQALHVGYSRDDIESKAGGIPPQTYIAGAIKIPASVAASYAGNQITGIDVGYGSATTKAVTLFISEDLNDAPLYTQDARIDKVSHWTQFDLTTPYSISGDKDIYVGYYLQVNSTRDYPLGADNYALYTENSCFMCSSPNLETVWGNFIDSAETFGNLCVRARIEGDKLPATLAMPQGPVAAPQFVRPGEKFKIAAAFSNWGNDDISSAELTYKIGDDEPVAKTFTFSKVVETGEVREIVFEDCSTQNDAFDLPVLLSLAKINGQAVNVPQVSSTFDCSDHAFVRTMVVEETTGTWCGNCPIGYVGLEYMRDNYTDGSYIGIAVHNRDDMADSDYDAFMGRYLTAAPQAVVNREARYTAITPDYLTLSSIHTAISENTPAYEGVSVTSRLTGHNTVEVSATAEFVKDYDACDFAFSFVLTEDGVGPYQQANYFSTKSSNGLATEFESLGGYTELMFNDVARYISSTTGHEDSAIKSVKRGDKVTYSQELPLDDCTNPAKVNVIALLLNREDGVILNAATIHADGTSGVQALVNDEDAGAPAEYYTLAGVRVQQPQEGIYIMRKGSTVKKVVVSNGEIRTR